MALLNGLLAVSARLRRLAVGTRAPTTLALPPTAEPPATAKSIEVHTTWATSKTRLSLGIATWRLVIDSYVHSLLVEGLDGHGVVKFATVIRRNPSDKTLSIESAKHSGAFSLAKSADTYLVSNTINLPQWTKYTTAFKADWTSDKGSAAARAVADIIDLLGRISHRVPRTQSKARVLDGGNSVRVLAAAMLATTTG